MSDLLFHLSVVYAGFIFVCVSAHMEEEAQGVGVGCLSSSILHFYFLPLCFPPPNMFMHVRCECGHTCATMHVRRPLDSLRCWSSPSVLFEAGSPVIHHCVLQASTSTPRDYLFFALHLAVVAPR